jgi:hypothetical protein
MHQFTLKRNHRKHHMALVSLYPAEGQPKGEPTHYYLSAGAYAEAHGRQEYQGLSVSGDIPIAELVRWGLRKGLLTWKTDGRRRGRA